MLKSLLSNTNKQNNGILQPLRGSKTSENFLNFVAEDVQPLVSNPESFKYEAQHVSEDLMSNTQTGFS